MGSLIGNFANNMTKVTGSRILGFNGNTGSSAFADNSTNDKNFRNMTAILNPIGIITGAKNNAASNSY